HPGTPDLWLALRDLFGEKGACGGCWCMYCRIGNEYRLRSQEANWADLHEVVTPPCLIAFDGELAVGWCQLTPRALLPWLDRAWQRIDDLPVWSISCFYVRKEYRRQGITSALIQKAIETARKAGYPLSKATRSTPIFLLALRAPGMSQHFCGPASGWLAAAHTHAPSCASIFDQTPKSTRQLHRWPCGAEQLPGPARDTGRTFADSANHQHTQRTRPAGRLPNTGRPARLTQAWYKL